MNKIRYKIQDSRYKLKGSSGFPCILCLDRTTSHSTRLANYTSLVAGYEPCTSHFERGFSLISAIFLLVVIAALGTFAVTISTSQQQSAVLDLRGASAYQAARAGIEWAAYGVSQTASGVQWTGCVPTTALTGLGGTLSPFTVTVTCATPTSYVEGSNKIWIYNVTSKANTAAAVGSPGYVERDISVKLGK